MPDYVRIFGTAEVGKVTGLTQRQIIHLAEEGLVSAYVKSEGVGSRRVYNSINLLEFLFIKVLLDAGIGLPKIRKLLVQLNQETGSRFFVDWGLRISNGLVVILFFKDASTRVVIMEEEDLIKGLSLLQKLLTEKSLNPSSISLVPLRDLKRRAELADGKILPVSSG